MKSRLIETTDCRICFQCNEPFIPKSKAESDFHTEHGLCPDCMKDAYEEAHSSMVDHQLKRIADALEKIVNK